MRRLFAPVRVLLPYLGLVAVVLGALLVWKLQDIASKTAPSPDSTISKQSDASHQLITDLREQFATLPPGGTLYVVNAPYGSTIFTDAALDNMVELYYGEVEVRSVPLKDPPFWNAEQVQAALRPQDRLFVFERGGPPANPRAAGPVCVLSPAVCAWGRAWR